MRTIDPTMSLGALVTAHPELAGEMERRGLDYCCRGRRSLADACRDSGLDLGAISAGLADALADREVSASWTSMDAADLVDHLVDTHHRYLWRELPRLAALVEKIVSVHGERHPELIPIAACFEDIRSDLEPHLLKEERVLFPMVKELSDAARMPAFHCGSIRNPISVMMREHDDVGELLANLRTRTDGYRVPADGCASYTACFAGLEALEADTHLHIHKENNLLFPMVLALEAQLAGAAG